MPTGAQLSAEIASLERVRQAAETLRRANDPVTAGRVIEVLGGGSKSTVLSHLRTIRDSEAQPTDIPPMVFDLARGAITEIYRAGRAAEAESLRTATGRLSNVIDELDAQIDELMNRNAELMSDNARRPEQCERFNAEVEELSQGCDRLQQENDEFRSQLRDDVARQEVKIALQRMEKLLEDKASATRRTMSLPKSTDPTGS